MVTIGVMDIPDACVSVVRGDDGVKLSDGEVALIGTIAWYVDGVRVATGPTYECAYGTAVECRLEA